MKALALFTAGERVGIDHDLTSDFETEGWKTEGSVVAALRELGHTTEYLALFDDMELLRQKLQSFQPEIIFNLADEFKQNRAFVDAIFTRMGAGCGDERDGIVAIRAAMHEIKDLLRSQAHTELSAEKMKKIVAILDRAAAEIRKLP